MRTPGDIVALHCAPGCYAWVARWLSGSRGAYRYLPDSVSRFPDQERLAALMRGAGFEEVGYRNLTGGIAALHTGTRARRM